MLGLTVPEPFVVCSTPKYLSERFLKWNSVGIVLQCNTGNECSIDVEFHDVSVYPPVHIENSLSKYNMADLSIEALALASSVDDTVKSRLYVLNFFSWDSSKDWFFDFPDGEDICCLCIGVRWIAVGTRQKNVRIFTVAGIQSRCFTAIGPIVTMAAGCSHLLVAFVDGLDYKGSSKISCVFYRNPNKFDGTSKAENIGLSLTCESTLAWLGFSTEGTPCLADSLGMVRMYDNSTWIQIFDSKIETDNNLDMIWIISVHEYLSEVHGVPCNGAKFPTVSRRPVAACYSWRFNLLERDTEKSLNEENFLSCNMRKGKFSSTEGFELMKKEFDSLLRLFVLAYNAERECQALDVALLTDSYAAQSSLQNVATKKERTVLAEKISNLSVLPQRVLRIYGEEPDDRLLLYIIGQILPIIVKRPFV